MYQSSFGLRCLETADYGKKVAPENNEPRQLQKIVLNLICEYIFFSSRVNKVNLFRAPAIKSPFRLRLFMGQFFMALFVA